MSLETYRYYCLDGTGKLHNAELIHAKNDEDAIARVEAKHPNAHCEVWQDKRLVAKLSPKCLEASDAV